MDVSEALWRLIKGVVWTLEEEGEGPTGRLLGKVGRGAGAIAHLPRRQEEEGRTRGMRGRGTQGVRGTPGTLGELDWGVGTCSQKDSLQSSPHQHNT